ncbi:MAG: helicase-related protein [Clostridia bacterium]|nr:helicase [Clostridia bacterium]MDD4501916.1 helicase-related protein [Clostridia bacterium]NLV33167.1 helicase [Clostridiaceae bacterium]HQM95964.1 helicase-related protein [Clostridia bacterium]
MTKKYIEQNNSPEAVFLYSLLRTVFERNPRQSKKPISKNRLIKMSSALNYASKQKLTAMNAEMYLKKSRHLVYSSIPYKDKLNIKENCYDEIFKNMAVCELYLFNRYNTGSNELPDMFMLFDDNRNISKLKNNTVLSIYMETYLKRMAKEQIQKLIPSNPKDEFPDTRRMKRKFVIHLGLTNTGKTYHALNALKEAKSGAYLSPLRLLALEVQERLMQENVLCSMITGEEEDIIPGARHVSSTVEKADYEQIYDIVVIDECQLIQDESRGCYWTKSILGMKAAVIHLCAAPEAEDILVRIIKDCNEDYDIIRHERNTELIFSKSPFTLNNTQKGDALVVFSRKSVLRISEELSSYNKKASIIYGALPYKTRKEQLKLFLEGKTDVVVATDAIGMGLNLPIKRIVFLETEKYDGNTTRPLVPWEVKQIAGRAGRRGIYEKGYVSAISDTEMIKKYLTVPNTAIEYAYLGFSDILLDIECDITQTLRVWKSIPTGGFYVKQDISRVLNLCEQIRKIYEGFNKKELLKLSSIPFDEENKEVMGLFKQYTMLYSYSQQIFKPKISAYTLNALEDYYKCLDLYYSFSKNMGYIPDLQWLKETKLIIAEKINKELISRSSYIKRRCSCCNRPLSKIDKTDICRSCMKTLKEVDFELYKS